MTTTPFHLRPLTEEQRQAIAQREAARQRMEAIFQPTDGLNVEAITLLIGWAEEDQTMMDQFNTWGRWDQGHWSVAEMDTDEPTTEILQSHHDDMDEEFDREGREVAVDVLDKAILNGVCQTAYCMAGQTVVQAGRKILYDDASWNGSGLFASADQCVEVQPTGSFNRYGYPVTEVVDGTQDNISSAARRILGLSPYEADEFFAGDNSIMKLKQYANKFARDRDMEFIYPDEDLPYSTE
jgi:hypothetical protein